MSLAESIVDFLRPRRLLVVLDNCEHLLDAAAGLADAIMAGPPGVRILATSREGLGVPGEHIWPLRSLPVDNDRAGERSDAVVLFAEQARAVAPDFAVDARSAAAVTEICVRLDGIPLAIELAAARVAAMSPGEIAGHLDERFRLLTGGRRGRVERHQTLRATVEGAGRAPRRRRRPRTGRGGPAPWTSPSPAHRQLAQHGVAIEAQPHQALGSRPHLRRVVAGDLVGEHLPHHQLRGAQIPVCRPLQQRRQVVGIVGIQSVLRCLPKQKRTFASSTSPRYGPRNAAGSSDLWDAVGAAVSAPSGAVTFVFIDIEGSTRLWETAPGAMRAAPARRDAILRAEGARQDQATAIEHILTTMRAIGEASPPAG